MAASALGYPFNKEVSDANERPAGCFWDQNGYAYFNNILDATVTWGGVGGICGKHGKIPLFKCCDDRTYFGK